MRVMLLWVLVAAPVFASGMSVCLEWEVVDAGVTEDGGSARVAEDGGTSIYRAPPRRCLRYGFQAYDQPGCSSVPGESLILLALLVARWRR